VRVHSGVARWLIFVLAEVHDYGQLSCPKSEKPVTVIADSSRHAFQSWLGPQDSKPGIPLGAKEKRLTRLEVTLRIVDGKNLNIMEQDYIHSVRGDWRDRPLLDRLRETLFGDRDPRDQSQ
jgi:hypothetical protein